MKKLISILISAVSIVQMLALPVSASESDDTLKWDTVQSFGIIGEDKGKDAGFTIADMSVMIYRLLNLDDETQPVATHQIYTDVDRWHWAAGYIEWLYNNSVYTGDGSGVLEPERGAKLSDVCTVALNLLGYTRLMKSVNDDTDSIKKALQIGLIPAGVSNAEHEVTYGEFASICHELLFTKVMKQEIGVKETYSRGGEFINEVLELEYNTGIMSGANGYSLGNDYCNTEEVIIDGMRFAADSSYSDFLGYRVKYYYDPEDDELIAAVPFENKELVVKSEDILKYQNNAYTIDENGRTKTKKCEDVSLLYNGKITANRNAFTPSYGQVRLIDNDNDGKFECVISEDAVNIILEKIVDGVIYGKNNDADGNRYKIDTSEMELVNYVGNSATAEELKENTVISAVISEDGEYGTFYVSEKKASGILDGFDAEDFIIDGVAYTEAANMYNPDVVKTPGRNVVAGVDIYGCIAYIKGDDGNKYLFGYVIAVREDESEEKLIFKLLTGDGVVKNIYASDRLYIDGVRMNTTSDAKNSVTEEELIRYRLSNGEIKYIDTATRNSGFSDFVIDSDSNALTMTAEGKNMLYKSSPQIFKYYGTAMNVHSEFAVDDNSVIFFVPTAEEYKRESDYYVGSRAQLRNDLTAEVQAYVTGKDAFFAEVVVVKYSTMVHLETKFTIVDKISETVNVDDEIVSKIHGLSSGKEIEVTVPDKALLANIENGSIIRYQTNKDGEVKSISNIYGINGTGSVNTSAGHSWTSGSAGVNANVRAVVGYVQDRRGTVVRFSFKDNASADELFNLKNCNIYVYDEEGESDLRMGTVDDLYDYARYGAECDEVIICTRAAAVCDVFLIKK